MTERPLPQDPDAEMALLGSMMMDRACIDEVLPVLPEGSKTFSVPQHGLLWDALVSAHSEGVPIELVALSARLRANGTLEKVGGQGYMVTLSESYAEWANAPYYAGLVRKAYQCRECIRVADKFSASAYQPMADAAVLCAEAQAEIDAILKQPASERMVEIRSMFPKLQAMWANRAKEVVATGYKRFDAAAGGFERPSMVVIGARPSAGKTALALALCLQAVRQMVPVLFVSLETTVRRLAERLTAMLAGHSVRRLSTLATPSEQAHALSVAAERITGAPFYVVDQLHTRNLRDIMATCHSLCRQHGIGLIVVDYLQLVTVEGRVENRTQEVTKISAAFKDLAIRANAVVVALSQLSRGVAGQAPSLGSLRESGAIEQDADMVILLHREELDETNEEKSGAQDREIAFHLAKNKDGPTFREMVKFNAPTMLFWPNVGSDAEPRRADHAIGMEDAQLPF